MAFKTLFNKHSGHGRIFNLETLNSQGVFSESGYSGFHFQHLKTWSDFSLSFETLESLNNCWSLPRIFLSELFPLTGFLNNLCSLIAYWELFRYLLSL